jgi:hypothetical protein
MSEEHGIVPPVVLSEALSRPPVRGANAAAESLGGIHLVNHSRLRFIDSRSSMGS